MAFTHDCSHGTGSGCGSILRERFGRWAMDRFTRRDRLLRYACIAMVIAAGLQSVYGAVFAAAHLRETPYWTVKWAAAYALFVLAYALTPTHAFRSEER